MSRPKTITNEQIVEAARQAFLEGGYNVSTAALARAAGVSEGTLFNRFGSKEALFKAAMGIPEFEVVLGLDALDGDDLRADLETVGTRLVAFYRELLPRMQLLCTRPGFDHHEFVSSHPNPPPLRAVRLLTHWLEGQIQRGRLRPCDPEVVARMMMGSLHAFVFFEMVGINQRLPMAATTFVRGMVDIILKGTGPQDHE